MTQANSALSRANSVLRANHLPLRQRAGHNSRWVSIYENLPGRQVRERSVRGCSSQDDQSIEELCFQLVSEARKQPDASLEQLLSAQLAEVDGEAPAARLAPCWPEICEAVVASAPSGREHEPGGAVQGPGLFPPTPS